MKNKPTVSTVNSLIDIEFKGDAEQFIEACRVLAPYGLYKIQNYKTGKKIIYSILDKGLTISYFSSTHKLLLQGNSNSQIEIIKAILSLPESLKQRFIFNDKKEFRIKKFERSRKKSLDNCLEITEIYFAEERTIPPYPENLDMSAWRE